MSYAINFILLGTLSVKLTQFTTGIPATVLQKGYSATALPTKL